jgi:hypothetical protein
MMEREDPDSREPLVADVDADSAVGGDSAEGAEASVAEGGNADTDESERQQDAPAGESAVSVEDGADADMSVAEGADAGGKRKLPRAVSVVIALVAVVLIAGGAVLLVFATGSDAPAPPASQPGVTEPAGVTTVPGDDVPKTSGNENPAVNGVDGDADTDAPGEGGTGTDGGNTGGSPAVSNDPYGPDEGDSVPGTPGGSGGGGGGTGGGGTNGGSGGGGTGGSGSTGGTGGSGTGGSGGNSNMVWHPGWYEWVVDVPGHYEQRLVQIAWDEKIGHYGAICWDCGAEITGNITAHLEETGHIGGYYIAWILDEVIHHEAIYEDVLVPEQGHNVWHEGYWE